MDADASSSKPCLDRDMQILVGEQVTTRYRQDNPFIDDGFFNFFCATPIIRSAALSKLAKLTILTVNGLHVRLGSPDEKDCLYIDLSRLSGYLYLERLIAIIFEFAGEFIQELLLISLKDVDLIKFLNILSSLKGLRIISLPYEFDVWRSSKSKRIERLIESNASSLVAIRHLTLPMIPVEMRQNLKAVNCSTLRSGSLDKEDDFYAYYTDEKYCPLVLLPFPQEGIVMRVCIHRHREVLRAIKRIHKSFRDKITVLKFTSVYEFDTAAARSLLLQISRIKNDTPKLAELDVELKIFDTSPGDFASMPYAFENGDFEEEDFNLVSNYAMDCVHLAQFLIDWLRAQHFSFKLTLRLCLAVDYHMESKDMEYLERAMAETRHLLGDRWLDMRTTVARGGIFSSAEEEVSDNKHFIFSLEFRSLVTCKDGLRKFPRQIDFNNFHSL